jgi:AraC family transcriptional regulator
MEQDLFHSYEQRPAAKKHRLLGGNPSGDGQGAPSRTICDLRVATAMRLVETQFDQPLTTASLADAVGLSRFYFIRLFQDRVGETIMDYIRRIRLEKSASILLNSSEPIVEVGLSVGYGSQSAFTRAFTHYFHVSPADYRRKLRKIRDHDCDLEIERRVDPSISVHRSESVSYLARRYLGRAQDISPQWDTYLRDICFGTSGYLSWPRTEIVYDDDRITESTRMRADLCLSLPSESQTAHDLCPKGFQVITVPPSIYAVVTTDRSAPMSDRKIATLLDVWLGQQKRYRRRTDFAMMKLWSPWNGSRADQPDRILVPLNMT